MFELYDVSATSPPQASPAVVLSNLVQETSQVESQVIASATPTVLTVFTSERAELSVPQVLDSTLSSVIVEHSSFKVCSMATPEGIIFPLPMPPPVAVRCLT